MIVFLKILQIIGIVLLIILALVLLVLYLVFFVPVRYKAAVNLPDRVDDQGKRSIIESYKVLDAYIKASYLLNFLEFSFAFKDSSFTAYFRVLFKKIPINVFSDSNDDVKEEASRSKDDKKNMKEDDGNKKDKLKSILDKARSEKNKDAIKTILSEITKLLKKYGPRKINGQLSFSLGDPANTGYFLGLLSVFPGSYNNGFSVFPDFNPEESLYAYGEFNLSGHIRFVSLVNTIIRIYRNKNSRRLIKGIFN